MRRLAEFSTFGIGGEIRYFFEVRTLEEMREGMVFAEKENLPFFVLGKGSNCLFDDRGFSGVVLLNKIDSCVWGECSVTVGSGYSFSLLGTQTSRKGWAGLEFASGIPASVGGAIFMNAGANGKETCEALVSVDYLHADGTYRTYSKSELYFSYRKSSFQSMQGAIVSATFMFQKNEEARQKQLQIISHRQKTQPLKEKSIGCIFRNPSKEVSAGYLIDQCGLKGFVFGKAKVSDLHANFIINPEGASAADVRGLIAAIQSLVLDKTGVYLEPEIRLIPYE